MLVPTDLHGHTVFSDGRASPEEYVDFRREHRFSVIAISDHDVLAGVRRGAVRAAAARIMFLPAVEVTSFFHFGTPAAEQVHVLAYFPPEMALGPRLESTALFRRGLRVQATWRDFVLEWLDTLPADERALLDPTRELEGLSPGEFPALQPMIDRIVARHRPCFERFRDHHVRFWEEGRELFGWEPEEAMDFIRADGAVDIVAHPTRYRDKERLRPVLERAQGVEVYTSRHKAEVAAAWRAWAEEHHKLWTSASDDHQNARYVRPPYGTPHETLERILRRPLPLELVRAA